VRGQIKALFDLAQKEGERGYFQEGILKIPAGFAA
jgi:hypothetical protein